MTAMRDPSCSENSLSSSSMKLENESATERSFKRVIAFSSTVCEVLLVYAIAMNK